MSHDDSLVRNFLIQAMKSRPFFWDKSREDFNNFKSADTSKKEWLDILEEVGVMSVMFLYMHVVMIDNICKGNALKSAYVFPKRIYYASHH